MGYPDGANRYEAFSSSPVALLDPLGLKVYTHQEAIDYFRQNKDKIQKAMQDMGEKDCNAFAAAMTSVYIEMRRDPAIAVTKNMGKSTGPGQIKPDFVRWTMYNNAHGFITQFSGLSGKQLDDAIAQMIQDEPMRIAIAAMRAFIDQWDHYRMFDPAIADLSGQPIILSSLYNLGPSRSKPKPNPGPSEGQIAYADGTKKSWGDRARDFLNDPFVDEMRKWCEGNCTQNSGASTRPSTQPSR